MKYSGSIFEFTHQRNADLMRAYRHHAALMARIDNVELGRRVVNSPSVRFWVSAERATVVVSQLLRGLPVLRSMRRHKREMFEEIYRRFLHLRRSMPAARIIDIVSVVVDSPAPRFYMTPRSAIETIYKIKNGFYERQRENLKHIEGKR